MPISLLPPSPSLASLDEWEWHSFAQCLYGYFSVKGAGAQTPAAHSAALKLQGLGTIYSSD